MQARGWTGEKISLDDDKDLNYHAALCLRGCITYCITCYNVHSIHELYQHAVSRNKTQRLRAVHHIHRLFNHLHMLGFGVMKEEQDDRLKQNLPVFHKYHFHALPASAQALTMKWRIPFWSFGADISMASPAIRKPEVEAALPVADSIRSSSHKSIVKSTKQSASRAASAQALGSQHAQSSIPDARVGAESNAESSAQEEHDSFSTHFVPGSILVQASHVKEEVQQICEREGFAAQVMHLRTTPDFIQHRGWCLHDDACPKRWSSWYYRKNTVHPVKTLVIKHRNTHVHLGGAEAKNTKRIMTPLMEKEALDYLHKTPNVSCPGLRRHLRSLQNEDGTCRFPKSSLPAGRQVSQWVARKMRQLRAQGHDARPGGTSSKAALPICSFTDPRVEETRIYFDAFAQKDICNHCGLAKLIF